MPSFAGCGQAGIPLFRRGVTSAAGAVGLSALIAGHRAWLAVKPLKHRAAGSNQPLMARWSARYLAWNFAPCRQGNPFSGDRQFTTPAGGRQGWLEPQLQTEPRAVGLEAISLPRDPALHQKVLGKS